MFSRLVYNNGRNSSINSTVRSSFTANTYAGTDSVVNRVFSCGYARYGEQPAVETIIIITKPKEFSKKFCFVDPFL
jgi:hypothetical protein